MDKQVKTVGILAYQGSVEEHEAAFERMNVPSILVKEPEDLAEVTHLVIPGGESSVIGDFLKNSGLSKAITKKFESGELAIWGTCAGAILLGRSSSPYSLELIDADVDRNAYGSQIQSFRTEIETEVTSGNVPAVFIRAPKIAKTGEGVKILALHEGSTVLCQEGRILISTFHPELTRDTSIQEYFLTM